MKNYKLGTLDFAELDREQMDALRKAEQVINREGQKPVYLMALCEFSSRSS